MSSFANKSFRLTAIGKPCDGLVCCKYCAASGSAWKKSSPLPPKWIHVIHFVLKTKIILRCNNESLPSGPAPGIGCGVNGYSKYRCSPAGVNVGVCSPTAAGI
jgi:hypothetical protein